MPVCTAATDPNAAGFAGRCPDQFYAHVSVAAKSNDKFSIVIAGAGNPTGDLSTRSKAGDIFCYDLTINDGQELGTFGGTTPHGYLTLTHQKISYSVFTHAFRQTNSYMFNGGAAFTCSYSGALSSQAAKDQASCGFWESLRSCLRIVAADRHSAPNAAAVLIGASTIFFVCLVLAGGLSVLGCVSSTI